MPKIKTVKITDAASSAKMAESVNKVLKTVGLAEYLKVKAPSDAWVKANAPDGKLDIILEASIDPAKHQGPIKVTAKAGNGQTSVMGVYSLVAAKYDALAKNLKASGLM